MNRLVAIARRRLCQWCDKPIPPTSRRDAKHCGVRCRQSNHRFGKHRRLTAPTAAPLFFAYADPPYPGMAKRYYGAHRNYKGEVNYARMIEELVRDYDHWALSTSSASLQAVLALCPPGVRVNAWFRGCRPTMSYHPLQAWEPVITFGGRARRREPKDRVTDALVYHGRPRRSDPKRVVGAKPSAFAFWLFDVLGARPGDELVDLFPGSGGIMRAWRMFSAEH